MIHRLLPLIALGIVASTATASGYRIEGIVVNGTQGDAPIAGAEVILRAGEDGALRAVAKTSADPQGRFVFDNLPVERGLIYRPGANRQGIHYPGPRLVSEYGAARVKVTAYDTVKSPSPLVAERHELDIQVETGVITVKETLVVDNPSRATYVGESAAGGATVTLSLNIPPGYEKVTFTDEFHGRHFQVIAGRVVTDIPWTPGKRELKYTYQLPVEEGKRLLERSLDLPSSLVRVHVRGKEPATVVCNLPRTSGAADQVESEFSERQLGQGHVISLEFPKLAAPWIVSARWTAIGVLLTCILGTVLLVRRSFRARQPA